jgi:hypothetical protein
VRRALALVAACTIAAACGGSSKPALPDLDSFTCPTTASVSQRGSSLPALAHLATLEATPIAGRIVSSGHGPAGAEAPVTPTHALERELRAASDAACALRTSDDARRAGYVLSSAYTEGVGTHWTNWSLVDAPFDPARPSMLLYAPRHGVDELVGFSYWVRSPAAPAGFTGDADHWHRHFGLCFDHTGMLQQEGVANARQCDGTWLNGSDLWMLHAWVAPGYANAWGTFAPMNPSLCRRNVPDILRCPST